MIRSFAPDVSTTTTYSSAHVAITSTAFLHQLKAWYRAAINRSEATSAPFCLPGATMALNR